MYSWEGSEHLLHLLTSHVSVSGGRGGSWEAWSVQSLGKLRKPLRHRTAPLVGAPCNGAWS